MFLLTFARFHSQSEYLPHYSSRNCNGLSLENLLLNICLRQLQLLSYAETWMVLRKLLPLLIASSWTNLSFWMFGKQANLWCGLLLFLLQLLFIPLPRQLNLLIPLHSRHMVGLFLLISLLPLSFAKLQMLLLFFLEVFLLKTLLFLGSELFTPCRIYHTFSSTCSQYRQKEL